MRPLSIAVPKKGSDRWLYEILRHLQLGVQSSQSGLNAIVRGEVPDGSGTPLPNPDLTGYFKLIGRADDQIGYGSIDASGALTFGSTSHATKGFVYIGTTASARVAYDETQHLVGINKDVPAATLHVVGSPFGEGAAILPNSNQNDASTFPLGFGWRDPVTGYGGAGTGQTHMVAVNTNDDPPTSSVTINATQPVGLNPEMLGLDTVIEPGQTYAITVRCHGVTYPTLAFPLYAPGSYLGVSLIDKNGDEWTSAANAGITYLNSPLADLILAGDTQYERTFTVTCSGTPVQNWISHAADGNPRTNCVAMYMSTQISIVGTPTGTYCGVNYIAINSTGSTLLRWDLSDGTPSGQVDIVGRMGVGTGTTDLDAQLTIFDGATDRIALAIKAIASQTANLVKLTNSAGTDLSGFTAAGNPYLVAQAALDALLVSDASGVGSWKELVAWEDEMLFYEDSPVYYP